VSCACIFLPEVFVFLLAAGIRLHDLMVERKEEGFAVPSCEAGSNDDV